jgi:hypothetical protein
MWGQRKSYSNNYSPVKTGVNLTLEMLEFRNAPSSILDFSTEDLSIPLADSLDQAALLSTQDGGPATISSISSELSQTAANSLTSGSCAFSSSGETSTDLMISDQATSPVTTGEQPPNPNAPQINNFVGVELGNGVWQFSGTVTDPNPGGLTVTFGGQPESLQGVTTTTDENGNFNLVIQLNTNGSDDGVVTTQTTDGAGLQSNVALCYVDPS